MILNKLPTVQCSHDIYSMIYCVLWCDCSFIFAAVIVCLMHGFLFSGKSWIKSMILAASLFPFMCFGIGFILNTIAIFYGSLAAIPFGTMVVVFIIWAFISFPLALLGTVVGRNWSGSPNNPCRVKTIPRLIPEKKWYLTPSIISLMGGLLPFGSIFIEMYFVFTSFWNYKVSLALRSLFSIEIDYYINNCSVLSTISFWLLEYFNSYWSRHLLLGPFYFDSPCYPDFHMN